MGATVIEKHFKLNDNVGGADASFSINEKDFKNLVNQVRLAESAMGIETYELTDKQISGKRYGRSIYISNDVKKGEILTEDNIKCVRPGLSLHPRHYNNILGKKVKNDFDKGSRIKLEDIQ